jgi:hypothetical protein
VRANSATALPPAIHSRFTCCLGGRRPTDSDCPPPTQAIQRARCAEQATIAHIETTTARLDAAASRLAALNAVTFAALAVLLAWFAASYSAGH